MIKRRILVTGGTGYIGTHTIVELQAKGFEVIVIDSLVNSLSGVLNQVEQISGTKPLFYEFDLCDKTALENLFTIEKNIDAIIHFAALKAVGDSVENPLLYYQNNMLSLMNVLDAMIKFKVILSDVVKSTSLDVISLRYFNPIGAHDSALIGEYPIGAPNNLVPMITQTAVGIREKLLVFGDDYNTKDGSCIRDYIHVVDIAKAHVVAIERLLEGKNKSNYEVFNLGTGFGFTVLETIKAFEKVSQQKLNYEITSRRTGDVEKVYADTQLANNELGWKAERDLENMLLTAWNWQLNLKELKLK